MEWLRLMVLWILYTNGKKHFKHNWLVWKSVGSRLTKTIILTRENWKIYKIRLQCRWKSHINKLIFQFLTLSIEPRVNNLKRPTIILRTLNNFYIEWQFNKDSIRTYGFNLHSLSWKIKNTIDWISLKVFVKSLILFFHFFKYLLPPLNLS